MNLFVYAVASKSAVKQNSFLLAIKQKMGRKSCASRAWKQL